MVCFGIVGCMTPPDARYVYQDGEYGVIGIPRNTSLGKKDYRAQAHELMARHFPEGYEIVRAEEVIEGERTLDTARKIELDSEPGVAALNQMIKVGKFAKSTSLDQKDSLKITESRIIYRRKPDGTATGHDGFTAVANLAPEFYLDPNQEVRKGIKEATLLARRRRRRTRSPPSPTTRPNDKSPRPKPKDGKADPAVQKAGNSSLSDRRTSLDASGDSWSDGVRRTPALESRWIRGVAGLGDTPEPRMFVRSAWALRLALFGLLLGRPVVAADEAGSTRSR